jgi:hypothetical protein
MKKLPKKFSVLVFGSKISVSLVPNLTANTGALGQYYKKAILIEACQDKENLEKTFLHEIIHALSDRIGLNQAISRELEEIVCESVANLIYENFDLQLK